MTIRDAAVLALAVGLPCALLYGLGHVSRWYAGRGDQIDALIHAKGARWRPDGHGGLMEKMDWQKAEKAGERRWQETLRAQRKTRKPPTKHPKPATVRRFPRAVGQ